MEDGEVREPVTGEARTGEANAETAAPATGVNDADGVSGGDVAGGGEPWAWRDGAARHGVEERSTDQVAISADEVRRDRQRPEARGIGPPSASSPATAVSSRARLDEVKRGLPKALTAVRAKYAAGSVSRGARGGADTGARQDAEAGVGRSAQL